MKAERIKFSKVPKIVTNDLRTKESNLKEYIYSVKNSSYIEELKTKYDNKHLKAYKLQSYLLAGTFSIRKDNAIIKSSKLLTIDIDNIKNESVLQEYKNRIINCELVKPLVVHKTLSGNGLRAIYLIGDDPNAYENLYRTFTTLFEKHLKIKIDTSCSNLSRAWCLSYDPEIWVSKELEL